MAYARTSPIALASVPWKHACTPWKHVGVPFFIPKSYDAQRTAGYVAAPEPSPVGRQGSEPHDAWQRRSPRIRGGEIRSCGERGNTGALLNTEAESGAL
jgi:hypothetical protein